MRNLLNRLLVTFFYSGLSPWAPGTAGSAAAFVVGVVILQTLGAETLFMATFGAIVLGVFETDVYQAKTGVQDPKEVVIDEVAGMWLAMLIVPVGWLWWGLTFGFFRLYDIWKPSVIGRIDRKFKNGLGVMLDDLMAGALAAISVYAVQKGLAMAGYLG